ncbi:MAG: MraY family glycosyltransferase [Verrucomicrobiota bacterium]
MTFSPVYYAAALAAGCAVSSASLPFWRTWCVRRGVVDDPGHRKIHALPIPLAGGLAVVTGLLVPILAAALLLWLQSPASQGRAGWVDGHTAALLTHGLERRALELASILAGAIGILIVGILDDQRELQPAQKFAGQCLVAFLVAAGGARITLFVPNVLFSYAVTILWILTLINAFNFMDNMNGLCTGLGVIAAAAFGCIAAIDGQYLVASIAFVACGALAGFLPYNYPRATAFLGDAGSHLTGYLLATLAILPHFYTRTRPHPLAVLSPLLILGVPLADLVSVVWIRTRAGRPFYIGDTNHLSHRLVRSGIPPARAVAWIWLLAALLALLAVRLAAP